MRNGETAGGLVTPLKFKMVHLKRSRPGSSEIPIGVSITFRFQPLNFGGVTGTNFFVWGAIQTWVVVSIIFLVFTPIWGIIPF